MEGTFEERQAKPLPCLYPGWADGGRRQPLSLTHPAVRHYPQLSNLGKSQTVRETGRDCQRSFGSSCILPPPRREALLFTWTSQMVCQPYSSPQQFLCPLSQARLPFRSSRWTSPNCQALWLLVPTHNASKLDSRLSLVVKHSHHLPTSSSAPECPPHPDPGLACGSPTGSPCGYPWQLHLAFEVPSHMPACPAWHCWICSLQYPGIISPSAL